MPPSYEPLLMLILKMFSLLAVKRLALAGVSVEAKSRWQLSVCDFLLRVKQGGEGTIVV